MTFIAIENMASAYGFKDKNTTNKPAREFESRGQQNRQRRLKQEIFEKRRALAEAVDFNPRKDPSEKDFLFVAQMFAAKRHDKLRYGICGSLNGMLKRMQFECANGRLKFDTLVFVGHGNAGLMTVGIGCTPLADYESLKEKTQKRTLEGLDLDGRMMNVLNADTWAGKFKAHIDCFKPDRENNTFHLFFAGCSTGNMGKRTHLHLTELAAETLAPMLACSVNAYGTDSTVENTEILFILENLEHIKSSATGVSGSYSIGNNRERGDDIKLDWVKRAP